MAAAAYLCAALRPAAAAARSPLRTSSRNVAPACRGYASEAHAATRITRLDNGVTVATEANAASPLATVGAWFAAGSRAETPDTPGAAHLLERVALKGTKTRSETALASEVERIGARLRSYTSREINAFHADVLKEDVGKMVGVIADVVTNPAFGKANFEAARAGAIAARAEADGCPESVTFDHLYATAFQGSTFGRPVIATESHLCNVSLQDVVDFHTENFTADRLVVAGAGNVNHDELVSIAGKKFGSLKAGPGRGSAAPRFVGSDVRLRDDTEHEMHVALAVRSPGLGDADYPTSLVMQAIVGSWDRSLGSNKNLFSKLSHQAEPFKLANSYASFCEAYSDVGLWGAYIISENLAGMDDLLWFLQKEWARLTESPTEGDVHIAKNKVRAALHHSLASATSAVADDIGRQVTATGARLSPRELGALVDRVTWKDVSRVAGEYLWDEEVAVVGVGPIEGLTDFVRIRGHMSRNIW